MTCLKSCSIIMALSCALLAGCISSAKHKEVVGDLERVQAQLSETEQKADADRQKAAEELAALERERTQAYNQMVDARSDFGKMRVELDQAKKALEKEQAARGQLAEQLVKAQAESRQAETLSGELRRERDRLRNQGEDLERRLETAQQSLASTEQAVTDASARNQALVQEKEALTATLSEATQRARELETRLEAERAQVAALQDDKQRLLGGTTTAQEEIARLQRRAGELEKEAMLAKDLARQVSERDQQIGELRRAVADREALASAVAAQQLQLDQTKQRVAKLTDELAVLNDKYATASQERDQYRAEAIRLEDRLATASTSSASLQQQQAEMEARIQKQAEMLIAFEAGRTRYEQELADKSNMIRELKDDKRELTALLEQARATQSEQATRLADSQLQLGKAMGAEEVTRSRLEQERLAQEAEMETLLQARQELEQSLESLRGEKIRLEREKEAKDEEIRRLTQTTAELSDSLRSEIEKGTIKIEQVRDRLTINMLDRILFDSGRAQVKPEGLKVLKQVSDVLKHITDKQIRIEGHTDNVPIGPRLRDRFPTNWELSTARATSVVRYLVEAGGVDPANLTAAGHADTQPVASNAAENGRAQNRRIEIVLYPKDFQSLLPPAGM